MGLGIKQIKAELSVMYPRINGYRWRLVSSHDTKKSAEERATTVRRVYGKARVRRIPESAKKITGRTAFGTWGVYRP